MLSKRSFLASAAAATLIGLSRSAQALESPAWDLVVVGGGNAGLPAAVFAAQRGARVLIVDAAGEIGGTLFLSSGQMAAAGTKLQLARGIEDSPQSHYEDVMRISGGTADPQLVRLAVFNAAPVFDWLMDNGLTVHPEHPIIGTTHEPYSHPRYVWGLEGGRSILKVLLSQLRPHLDSGRVRVLTRTEVVGLLRAADGSVSGVTVRSAQGERADFLARHTLLSSGGYTANPEMYQRLEAARDYSNATYPYSRGAGIELGLSAGGYVRGGERHTPLFGAVLASSAYPAPIRALVRHFPKDRPPWEIFVNAAGRRFLCEDVPSHNAYERALRAQREERCWVVFDDAIRSQAPALVSGGINGAWTQADTERAFASAAPMFFRAASVRELAIAAGIDAEGLAATIEQYNRAQSGGHDPLGRRYLPLPLREAPFHAIQLQSWNLTSYAGLAVDGRLRVIERGGRPIGNLHAAGELLGMGQLMGRCVCGGMSVTPALALGRLFGHEILRMPS